MSDSETSRGVLKSVSQRNILEELTESSSDNVLPVPSVADQKIAKQVLEQKKMMESKLEVLTDRRDLIMEKLIRMKESLRGEGVSIHLLNLHLETLRRCADEFDRIHSQISTLLPKEQRTVVRQEYAVFEDVHNELYVDLQTRIARTQEACRENPGTSSSSCIPGFQQPIVVQAAAPQLHAPFPKFDGTPENWYSFKSLFKSIMAKYPNESSTMKILYLRNSLEGDAKCKIDQDVVNNNDYERAWKILEDAYEDKRLILDTHIDAILDCAVISSDNRGKSISQLVETCSKHVDALDGHSYPVEGLGELILLNILHKKLDKDTQEQWETKVPRGELPEYETFMEFLRERGRVLQRTNRSQQQQVQQSTVQAKQHVAVTGHKTATQALKSFMQTGSETCPCCPEEHAIYRCLKFKDMNFTERKSVATRMGLCYNCLKLYHRVIDCKSDQRCKVQGCGRKHHSLLHPEDEIWQKSGERSPMPEVVEDNEPKQQEPDGRRATTMCALIDTAKRQVLLSTAEVLVVGHGGSTIKCRALLDSGSDSHIITERLANRLKLKMKRVDFPISGLNDIQTRVKYLVSTKIRSRINTYATSDLNFLVVPRISARLPQVEIRAGSCRVPTGLQLADPSFHVPGEVDMIIGNEIFFDLVKAGRLKIENAAITLAETEFGWIAGGSAQLKKDVPRAVQCQLNYRTQVGKIMEKFSEIENDHLGSIPAAVDSTVKKHVRNGRGRGVEQLSFNCKEYKRGDSFVMTKTRYESSISSSMNLGRRMLCSERSEFKVNPYNTAKSKTLLVEDGVMRKDL